MEEIRIAVLGNVDSAKTTLVSTITNKILDDGRGLARSKVFKHKHEKDTGRTSSISFKYVKINETKYITFIDLAGHEKYFKTTIHGINGGLADHAILVVGANMGVLRMTKEHLGIIKALNIPFSIVITKIDICPENVYERTYNEIDKIIKRNFKKELVFQDYNNENLSLENLSLNDNKKINMFKLSNVTGEGLNFFRTFLYSLNNRIDWKTKRSNDTIFWIDNVYYVKGIGIVVSGTVKTGEIKINDKLLLGPRNGGFQEVVVKSIHNNFREDVSLLNAGLSGCINIKSSVTSKKELISKRHIKRGMVMIQSNIIKDKKNKLTRKFKASITVLQHPTTIRVNYEPVIHCGKIAQSAKILESDNENLRTGEKGTLVFEFKYKAEFLEKEDILIFREGKTKGIGRIIELL